MKLIVSENQMDALSYQKKAEILSKLVDMYFPNITANVDINSTDINFVDDLGNSFGSLLFYFNTETKDFFISTFFLDYLHEMTGLPFLNYEDIGDDKRDNFNKIIKTFAKYRYSLTVNDVKFHWYRWG